MLFSTIHWECHKQWHIIPSEFTSNILHCTVLFTSRYTLPICTPVIFMWFCTTNDNYYYTRYLNKVKIIQRVWFVILTYCVVLLFTLWKKFVNHCQNCFFIIIIIIPSFNINRSGNRELMTDKEFVIIHEINKYIV